MVRDGYLISAMSVFATDKEWLFFFSLFLQRSSKMVLAAWEVVGFSSLGGGKSQRDETWLRYVCTLDNLEPSFLS